LSDIFGQVGIVVDQARGGGVNKIDVPGNQLAKCRLGTVAGVLGNETLVVRHLLFTSKTPPKVKKGQERSPRLCSSPAPLLVKPFRKWCLGSTRKPFNEPPGKHQTPRKLKTRRFAIVLLSPALPYSPHTAGCRDAGSLARLVGAHEHIRQALLTAVCLLRLERALHQR